MTDNDHHATDDELYAAINDVLESTDTALETYDQGYVDADATLSVIRTHLDDFRDEVAD